MILCKKICLAVFFCFLGLSLLSAKNSTVNSYKETKQQILPTCFSYFENLYFSNKYTTFFTLGENIQLEKAIYTPERRGFLWKAFKKMPAEIARSSYYDAPGSTIILFERAATPYHYQHFFHFLEHLLGIWNFGGEKIAKGVQLFLIASNGEMEKPENWEGYNQVTTHLIKALFPNAEIKLWADFMQETEGSLLCFEKVITSDRSMEYLKKEPYRTDRMLGGYFQNLTKKSLDNMAAKVHQYAQVDKIQSEKLVVTYVTRTPPRCLPPNIEGVLLDKIQQLPNVELRVVDFAALSFKEQINSVANTDVLIGVHGNGLSHALFLPSGASLIEIFPVDTFRVEYRILAKARELNYFGLLPNIGWIDDQSKEKLEFYGEGSIAITNADIDAIIAVLKECKKSQ